ncbi:MAG TPA: flagellar filament capping protein FliD [Sulfuricella sp.]|nr:flagellar filament capping protein FliD [Sulfuricella sp.]
MALSSPGIGSNLDVNGIVSKLMSVEQQPLVRLNTLEASYQTKLSAYGNLNSALSTFQTAVSGLTDLSQFQNFLATPGDTTIMTASATSSAVAGSYAVNVAAMAQPQTLLATGQTSTTAAIGTGAASTLTFQFGTITGGTLTNGIYSGATFTQDASQASGTVTIDSTNNSLQGIRDAINTANIGVTATIVNDGSAAPNRLVLTSSKTGATSSMKITVAGDATVQGLLAEDPAAVQNMTQSAAAQSASVTINGVAVASTSNTLTGAIPGVTLNLLKIGTTNLSVARNAGSVQTAVQAFVKAYNDINSTLSSLSSYDPATKKAGPLLGDSTVQTIQAQIRRTLSSSLAGLSGSLTTLSQIGVSFQRDGSMALDTTKLQNAITNNFGDVAGLFAAVGKTTDSLVNYSGSTAKTQAGSYAVNVTQLATQGSVTGNLDLNVAPNTVIAAGTAINVTLDGISASVGLTAGSYNASQLATMIQSVINGTSAFSSAGSSVAATVDATTGFLSVTSVRYGSASNASMTSGTGTAVSTFMGGTMTPTVGVDVAGTIGGMAAVGSGQALTGVTGSTVEGLKIQIAGGVVGARGTINFSNGYANMLNSLVGGFLASPSMVSSRTDGLNSSIKDIGRQRDELNRRLVTIEANYRAQYTALDVLIGSMQQTSNFLSQQLANLPKISK